MWNRSASHFQMLGWQSMHPTLKNMHILNKHATASAECWPLMLSCRVCPTILKDVFSFSIGRWLEQIYDGVAKHLFHLGHTNLLWTKYVHRTKIKQDRLTKNLPNSRKKKLSWWNTRMFFSLRLKIIFLCFTLLKSSSHEIAIAENSSGQRRTIAQVLLRSISC